MFLPHMGMAAILVMRPRCSELSFPLHIEAPCEILLLSAQWFLRQCLKSSLYESM